MAEVAWKLMKINILSPGWNILKNLISLLLIYFCASTAAFAGSQIGQVKNIIIRASDGLLYVEITGTAENKPGCATHSYWMVKDEKSLTGRQQLASLLLAQANGQTVSIIGTGSCARWPDGEDIDYIIINSK